jgi:hypothetical protein
MVLRRDLLTIHLDPGGEKASGVFVGGERQSLVVSGCSLVVSGWLPEFYDRGGFGISPLGL